MIWSNGGLCRLNAQYPFIKSVMGHPQVIPPAIDIARISRVIDVATGTGSWTIDFASLPEVRDSIFKSSLVTSPAKNIYKEFISQKSK